MAISSAYIKAIPGLDKDVKDLNNLAKDIVKLYRGGAVQNLSLKGAKSGIMGLSKAIENKINNRISKLYKDADKSGKPSDNNTEITALIGYRDKMSMIAYESLNPVGHNKLESARDLIFEGKRFVLPVNFLSISSPVENKEKFAKALKNARPGTVIKDKRGRIFYKKVKEPTRDGDWEWYMGTNNVIINSGWEGVYRAVADETTDIKGRPAPAWPSMIQYKAGEPGDWMVMEEGVQEAFPKVQSFFQFAKKGSKFSIGDMVFVVKGSMGYIEPPRDAISPVINNDPIHLLLIAYKDDFDRRGYSFVLDIPSGVVLVYPWEKTKTDSRGAPLPNQKSSWAAKATTMKIESKMNARDLIDAIVEGESPEAVLEKKWSADVDTKWSPPEGFFKQSADKIASGLMKASKDKGQASSRLNFYINRAGDNLSAEDKKRLDAAKDKLSKM